jgi:hypothetical protein
LQRTSSRRWIRGCRSPHIFGWPAATSPPYTSEPSRSRGSRFQLQPADDGQRSAASGPSVATGFADGNADGLDPGIGKAIVGELTKRRSSFSSWLGHALQHHLQAGVELEKKSPHPSAFSCKVNQPLTCQRS